MDFNLFSLLSAASFKWENMISRPCFDLRLTETLPVQSKMKYFRKELDSVKTVFCFYAASSFRSFIFFLINVIKKKRGAGALGENLSRQGGEHADFMQKGMILIIKSILL